MESTEKTTMNEATMNEDMTAAVGEAAEATEAVESTVSAAEKYGLRPLVASDMGSICKIITAIGFNRFKDCFKVSDLKKGNIEEIGFGVFFEIASIVIESIPRAEKEIQSFLASVTGQNVMVIKNMPFADYGELVVAVVMNDDFRDFFKRVMKLLHLS